MTENTPHTHKLALDLAEMPESVLRHIFARANSLGVTPEQAAVITLRDAARKRSEAADYGADLRARLRVRREILDALAPALREPGTYPAALEMADTIRSEIRAMEMAAEPIAASPQDD